MRSNESAIDYTSLGCLLSTSDPDLAPSGRLIYLVRHGEIQDAHLGRCIGRLDIPLSENGKIQAVKAGKWLAGRRFDFTLWSSPLTRCLETAEAIRLETSCGPVRIEENLAEMDAGIWDGMTFAEIQENYPAEYEERGKNLIHYQTPNGESFFDAGCRFLCALQKILTESAPDLPLVVVAHSGVIRSALCHLGAWSFDYMLCIPQPNAGVTVLQAQKNPDDSWQILPTEEIGIPTDV